MQTGRNVMETVKESAANVAASAKSGLEKSKATAQEKMETMTAHDPLEKEMAQDKRERRIAHAELQKQEAREQNAAAREANKAGVPAGSRPAYTAVPTGARDTATYSTTGEPGHPTGTHQQSALPGHGTGQPAGQVIEGVVGSHPVGMSTGAGRTSAAHNPRVEGTDAGQGYSTGGHYS